MKYFAVIAALLATPGLATAQDSTAPTSRDRFRLWNECKPIYLGVNSVSSHATEIGLTKERIETTVRSKLRAARIYEESASNPLILTTVKLGSSLVSVELAFYKYLIDPISEEPGIAQTWATSRFGTHDRNAGMVLQVVSEHTDKFIDEYLRVNADTCKR